MLSNGRKKSRHRRRRRRRRRSMSLSKNSFQVIVSDNNNNNNNNEEEEEETTNEEEAAAICSEISRATICLRVPEMKNELSYWQIGTSPVTRLKINSLCADVKIRTEEASRIRGMPSEFSEEVSTLGTAIINIFNKPVKVHVTRSKYTAPIVCDGILGYDFLRSRHAAAKAGYFESIPATIPISMGEELIADYRLKLNIRLKEARMAREKGAGWAGISAGSLLARIRNFVPPKVADDNRISVIETLEEYAHCFHLPGDILTSTELLKYKIKWRRRGAEKRVIASTAVTTAKNKLSRLFCSEDEWNEIQVVIDSLLREGIIRASDSAYNSPIRLIERKPDYRGKARYCLSPDYRVLNNNSESDAFPIPDIVQLTDLLDGSKYFSVFDLASACYQIELEPEDREKTAFSTRTKRYEFLRMPLGIKNSSQTIQRLLNLVVDEMLYASPTMAFVSYDDIIVYAPTIEEHQVRVRKLLSRIQDAGLKLQPSKCQMFSHEVLYLGYSVTDRGLCPQPEKIEKIRSYELPPKSARSLSRFLGLLSYFKRFIPNHAERIKPMSNLFKQQQQRGEEARKDTPPPPPLLAWTSEAVASFNDIKKTLGQELLLRYPNWKKPFILETNASDVGIQSALLQNYSINTGGGEAERIMTGSTAAIAYASRCYTPAELCYDKYNRARLAAMYGMDTWYWYLSGDSCYKFILKTPEPRAFDWYIKKESHNSHILRRFEMTYRDKKFTIESLGAFYQHPPPSS